MQIIAFLKSFLCLPNSSFFFFYFLTEQVSMNQMCMRINEAFVQKFMLQFSVYSPYPKHNGLSQTAFLQ